MICIQVDDNFAGAAVRTLTPQLHLALFLGSSSTVYPSDEFVTRCSMAHFRWSFVSAVKDVDVIMK